MPDSNDHKKVQVCVLAAGFSKRFGRAKLLEIMPDGRRLIDHSLQPYLALNLPLTVFLRREDHDLRAHLKAQHIEHNLLDDVSEGMSVTVRRAAEFCQAGDCPFSLLALADMPLLTLESLREFLGGIDWRDDLIAAPYSNEEKRLGNPVVFSRSFLPRFKYLKGDQGARPIINDNIEKLQKISCPHPGFYRDVDRPEDLKR